MHELELYVVDRSPLALAAIEAATAALSAALGDAYRLTVVDILVEPERARDVGIIATPTLVRVRPPPARRVVGDLGAAERVAAALELAETA